MANRRYTAMVCWRSLLAIPEYVSHKEWREGDEAFCTIVRMRFGENVKTTRSFSIADSKRAGLADKATWRSYPKRMLQMRARGFAARDSFPDALSGMVIKEEAMDYPTGEPEMKDITPEPDDNPMDAAFGGCEANCPARIAGERRCGGSRY